MENNSKIFLYKNAIIKFINTNIESQSSISKNKKNITIDKINSIDYLIGILFLTEMNRYCKINKISIHGYYIAYSLISFFIEIKQKMRTNKIIQADSIINFYSNLASNIEYLNSRVDDSNPIKKKISSNLTNLILEISPILYDIISSTHTTTPTTTPTPTATTMYIPTPILKPTSIIDSTNNYEFKSNKYVHLSINNDSNLQEVSNLTDKSDFSDKNLTNISSNLPNSINGCCKTNCYICWVDKILTKFFYILLIVAKFMGTGITNDPNLYKLAEYYANLFYTIIKLDDLVYRNNIEKYNDLSNIFQNLFNNYQEYKSKLIYSILELQINSETLDEIIYFLDKIIINKFLINNQ